MELLLTKLNRYSVPENGMLYTCKAKPFIGFPYTVQFKLERINSDVVNVLEIELAEYEEEETIKYRYNIVTTNKYLIADFLLDNDQIEIVLKGKHSKQFKPLE